MRFLANCVSWKFNMALTEEAAHFQGFLPT